ncbi:PASTA domain-containing protein [Micromonospora terminaliae]|uniref:PASTA domain-containing protein n=1 Tax=Micromonospora terminaliae TaxID=1914461 RepID=A0AAJ3DK69_9ACTN|nr:PASTA domain-containing protein [Micromonospora terminaliae]NES29659.1 PASTA domain-containing protein [Micromonospora terminaliae]QGL50148.1 PASTA domain-containing protein [Micromonospora terminaliae]
MTHEGYPDRQPAGREEPGPDRTRLLLGGGLAAVLLAVIGASGGWVLAGEPDRPTPPPVAGPTTPAVDATTPTAAPASTAADRPTGTRTTTPAGLTVPQLVGTDFEQARQELRDRRLGWRLVFGGGSGRTVERTSPTPGTPVKRGVTVTLWVAGPAPAVAVPDLLAQGCADAADDLVAAGLYPRYRTGREGPVTAQDPVPGSTARWNDPVTLACGDEPATTPTASLLPAP